MTLTGYLRFPESAGTLTPPENIAKRLWFTRDHLAMARTLGWGEGGKPVAPFYIDLETPVPASGIPKPGPLTVHLKDNHMQYVITWFGLAGAVVIAFGGVVARAAAGGGVAGLRKLGALLNRFNNGTRRRANHFCLS